MSRYPAGQWAVADRRLVVGQRVKLASDRLWWTVRAVTDHFAALTRHVEFRRTGTRCYAVLDWRNGVRGPCDLIGQGWGDGTYTEAECASLLEAFERGVVSVSQRNWVRLEIAKVEEMP